MTDKDDSGARRPVVTVILPVYNAEGYLPDVLDSLYSQTFQDFEIVAVDDGSSDASGEMLERYAAKEGRMRVLHRANGGCGAARNSAIALARGRYVAQQDADDLSAPSRLGKQVAFLEANPDIVAVYCLTTIVDEGLNPVVSSLAPSHDRGIRKALSRRNILQPNFMIRREVLEKVGGFREAILYSQDYDFNLRVIEAGAVACLPEALYIYRTHDGQTSTVKKREQNEYGSLARAFGHERLMRGRDGYDALREAVSLVEFIRGYEFRPLFNLIAGSRLLRNIHLREARPYLSRAVRDGEKRLRSAALLGWSYMPWLLHKAVSVLKTRLLKRRWEKRVPGETVEYLASRRRADAPAEPDAVTTETS